MKQLLFIFFGTLIFYSCSKVTRSILNHFDDKPITTEWWRVDDQVKFSYMEGKNMTPVKSSKVCLNVSWQFTPEASAYTWFTDLKIDSLRNPEMISFREEMGDNIWLSFWCKVNSSDTLFVQPMVLTYNHKGKWGCTEMTPITSSGWKFYKYHLSTLKYEKWGKEGGDQPDFSTNEVRCFELGLRKGTTTLDGTINADFDNLMISNFEPKGNE